MKPEDRYHRFVRWSDEDQYLIRVTATSILYGACREMIANFTARSLHGILSLPSISFRKPKTETQVCEFRSDHLIHENIR